MANDLHIFLKSKPTLREVDSLLQLYGYRQTEEVKSVNMVEPDYTVWQWVQPPLSGTGFKLLYFDGLFRDSLQMGKYHAFVALEGAHDSSEFDRSMIDITASLLLRRYGGILHNPQRTDRKHPNVFLCGKNNTKG